MSLFGSLTTAISGLSAQSAALGYISDNVANSQTVGFKRVDANFIDYLTEASATQYTSGSVIANPAYRNDIQGTLQSTDNPLALAIGGQGLFSVAGQNGTANGLPTFDARHFYSRAGDFKLNSQGYLTNGQNYFLQGWPVGAAGIADTTALSPIRISQGQFNPIATTGVQLAANLPADATTNPVTTQAQVYDTLGRQHSINLTFTPGANNVWNLAVQSPDDATATARGTVDVQFGNAGTVAEPDGTIAGLANAAGGIAVVGTAANGSPAAFTFTSDFGQGPQTVTLSLGEFGSSAGLTQYAGNQFTLNNLTQDGVPFGAFSGLTVRDNGDIAVNYDNGQNRIVAKVPLVAFSAPDQLQRLDGQAFMATIGSGAARVTQAGSDGVGKLVVGSVESSNVDIATEFSKLIVAQRAYTANTKIVTTTDQMLQDTINMAR